MGSDAVSARALMPMLVSLLALAMAACSAEPSPTPPAAIATLTAPPTTSPSPTASPSPSPSPTPLPSASPNPAEGHCPGTDKTPGRVGPAVAERSQNWAGYVIYDARTRITCVEGAWVQPSVTCSSTGEQDAAMWIGIDGVSGGAVPVNAGHDLVQIGTQAGCRNGQPSAFGWYQVLPEDELSVEIGEIFLAPGDRLRAMVSFAGDAFTLSLVDLTSHTSFSTTRKLLNAARRTAEWILEAPMIGCPAKCVIASLPRFDRVTFSQAFASTGTHRASIADEAWTHGPTDMVRAGIVRAVAARLTTGGTAFTVIWRHR